MSEKEMKPPFISVPGVLNFRDIGGYPIASQSGREVRRGAVYRSAEPSKITEAGCERIKGLGIATVYDLRSEQEMANGGQGSPFHARTGAETVLAPVFRRTDYSPEAVALRFRTYRAHPEGFAKAYSAILGAAVHPENDARPYARIMEHLAMTTDPQPILIHCQAGKDRTAIICALILSLCGVDDDVVAGEYSLSDVGLRSCHEQLVAKLLEKEEFREDPESARQMILTPRENMLLFLRELRREHASVEQGVINMKLLTAEGIERLKSNMIVDVTDQMIK
ncbi:putative tyrosine phosphatase [Rosellinia necatrix]|uniref:Putative tyrosine phosphatase n=1 Tax=Rosellinia necatrix TaxID=77044 RepID=A0A1W2TXD5_ROSNE|nr:putative tyrosine phosphatase [Rosellinia necatrix]